MSLSYSHPQTPGFVVTKLTLHQPPSVLVSFAAASASASQQGEPQPRRPQHTKASKSRQWTPEQDKALLAANPSNGPFVDPKLPNRSATACQARFRHLCHQAGRDLKRCRESPWTEDENQVLWNLNPEGRRFKNPSLPGRSVAACKRQIVILRANHKEKIDEKEDKKKHGNEEIGVEEEEKQPLTDFDFFNNLPPELRDKIWQLACCEQRIVEVHPVQFEVEYSVPDAEGKIEEHSGPVTHFRSTTLSPTLTRVNRESRGIALKMYGTASLANPFVPDSVFFDSDIDTIFLKEAALDVWAGPRGRTFFLFPSFRKVGEQDCDTSPQNYRTIKDISFPLRSPAGRVVMRLRTLAIHVNWFLDLTWSVTNDNCVEHRLHCPHYVFHPFNPKFGSLMSLRSGTHNILSNLFYLSDLEQLILIFDGTTRYVPSAKLKSLIGQQSQDIDRDAVEELRTLIVRCMEFDFKRIENTLTGGHIPRYSRKDRTMPAVTAKIVG